MTFKVGDIIHFPNSPAPQPRGCEIVEYHAHDEPRQRAWYSVLHEDDTTGEMWADFVDAYGVWIGNAIEDDEPEVVELKLVPHPTPAPRADLKWVGVDLDGTLAEPVWTAENPTHEIGTPIQRNIEKLMELHRAGYKVVIHTSRAWTDYEIVESWLDYYAIPYKMIQMGKPLYALYVDDRGRHESAESWIPNKEQSG